MGKKTIKIAILVLALVAAFSFSASADDQEVKIFHAGSLAAPMSDLEDIFESNHLGVDVQREASGSNVAVRKITELDKSADILNSADYELIPKMMYPDYADWYIAYASNDMVLAYTDDSKYADEINPDNWYEILRRPDVSFFFSNPNDDPCGYRSPMVIQLAEFYYNDTQIFDDLVEANTDITSSEENGVWMIAVPPTDDLVPPKTKRLTIRSKSTEALALLDSHEIDYAFEYESVAVQHNLKYVDLPKQIDLSSVDEAESYARVKLERADGTTSTAKPIVYGFTIPFCAKNPELAQEFAVLMLSEEGIQVFKKEGQLPIVPANTDNIDEVPDLLKPYVVEI
ncbi:MAG: tungstate ABC transporter substrate-binding protein WtpA [Methanotrichaceae archaeon]